jgi:acyl carrier protein
MQILSQVREEFRVDIPLTAMFDSELTVSALAAVIEQYQMLEVSE